jgi:hypothetical protein
MKRNILNVLTVGLLMTLPVALSAQDQEKDKKGRVVTRQANQQKRIAKGVKSGELTGKEAVKLERKEAKLAKEIRKDRKDGPGLTPKERAKIEKKQDKLSREIAKEKHDKQVQKQ